MKEKKTNIKTKIKQNKNTRYNEFPSFYIKKCKGQGQTLDSIHEPAGKKQDW